MLCKQSMQSHSLNPLTLAGLEPYPLSPDEEYLSCGQKAHFELLLRRWCSRLKQENQSNLITSSEEAINAPDLNDRATQEEALVLELKNRERKLHLIQKIERTLQRLHADLFGYCEVCGEEIGIRRLEARPTAVLCLECKQISELQRKYTA